MFSEGGADLSAQSCKTKIIVAVIIAFFIGMGLGVLIIDTVARGTLRVSDTAFYKGLLWDVYDDYSMAMRDMEAAADLVKVNYYAQHLQDPYRRMWILDGPSPKFYAEDAMKQMDKALERLTKIEWPEGFRDEVSQLKTYITELRQLVLKMQEIANKDTYTDSDVDRAEALIDSFHGYNDKIFDLINGAP